MQRLLIAALLAQRSPSPQIAYAGAALPRMVTALGPCPASLLGLLVLLLWLAPALASRLTARQGAPGGRRAADLRWPGGRAAALPALLALALLGGCRAEANRAETPAPPPPARPVQVAEIRLADAPDATRRAWTGTVRARREADLGFRASGRIVERLVDVGATVQAGQPLARLDPADLTLALRAAEADLAGAEAQARQAANDATRSRALLAAGHVARAYDDQRQAAARSAAERAEAARAQLALARNRLDYAVLRAPTAGVVTTLLAEAGQVVTEGQPVLRLANPAERELLVQVPEAALSAGLAPGAAAAASFWARPGEAPLPVRLREIAPQAEGALRTHAARFALPADAPDWVTLGMTGTVRLADRADAAAGAARVATVPLSALHDRGAGPMVWKLDGDGTRLAAVPVEVVALGEVTATLRAAALAEGDRIVALGPQLLDPGARVRVVQTRLAGTLR